MARIRSIKPAFFRHFDLYEAERLSGLPLRVAFAGLWTAADREGRFRWADRELKLDCLPHDDLDFARVLDVLDASGFVARYEVAGRTYGCIPSWKDHQVINQREAKSTIPAPPAKVLAEARARTCVHMRAQDGREGKGREEVPSQEEEPREVIHRAPVRVLDGGRQ